MLDGLVLVRKAILVIKHAALGDLLMATTAFNAIRISHPNHFVVLLTSRPYRELGSRMPYFDAVWVDDRPKFWRLLSWWRVLQMLKGQVGAGYQFERVYDLQCSRRTGRYFRLLSDKPEWFGAVKGCSHPRPFSAGIYHAMDSYVRHFGHHGIAVAQKPDVSWLAADVSHLALPQSYVVMIPDCSPKHPHKRWSTVGFAAVVEHLSALGIASVFVGASEDRPYIQSIFGNLGAKALVVDAVGQSPVPVLVSIARGALGILGVDTGPTHWSAATGTSAVVLFSNARTMRLCRPVGDHVKVVYHKPLSALSAEVVCDALGDCLPVANHLPQMHDA